jgi:hypothetical protein
MCRPPCCRQPSGEGAGIAAVAILVAAGFAYAKIGPAVARIWHVAVEALTIAALGSAAAAAVIAVIWATARILRRRQLSRLVMLYPVPSGAQQLSDHAGSTAGCRVGGLDCPACGDSGTVLLAITGGRYEERSCPVCQPVPGAR